MLISCLGVELTYLFTISVIWLGGSPILISMTYSVELLQFHLDVRSRVVADGLYGRCALRGLDCRLIADGWSLSILHWSPLQVRISRTPAVWSTARGCSFPEKWLDCQPVSPGALLRGYMLLTQGLHCEGQVLCFWPRGFIARVRCRLSSVAWAWGPRTNRASRLGIFEVIVSWRMHTVAVVFISSTSLSVYCSYCFIYLHLYLSAPYLSASLLTSTYVYLVLRVVV